VSATTKPYRALLLGLSLLPWSIFVLARDWAAIESVVPALLIGIVLLCTGLAALERRVREQKARENA